jgi:hypothetical protein
MLRTWAHLRKRPAGVAIGLKAAGVALRLQSSATPASDRLLQGPGA